jgi:hypothetical protein
MTKRPAYPAGSHGAVKKSAVVLGLALALSLTPRAAEADEAGDAARDAFIRDQRNHMTVLGAYALGSVAAGIPMMTSARAEVRAAGLQNLAWGAVDGVIALVALVATNNLKGQQNSAAYWADERGTSRRIFAINAGLDVLYVATGALLLALGKTEALRGTGAAVLVQGGFLLSFDTAGVFVMAPR